MLSLLFQSRPSSGRSGFVTNEQGMLSASDAEHPSAPPSPAQPQSSQVPQVPQVPRNSVMTNLGMLGNGDAGSATGRASTFGIGPRMSTFSMATNLNPFAGETDPNPNPTDDEIAAVLRGYLSSQDLMTVTKK